MLCGYHKASSGLPKGKVERESERGETETETEMGQKEDKEDEEGRNKKRKERREGKEGGRGEGKQRQMQTDVQTAPGRSAVHRPSWE